jgi:hypothetical protein
MADTSPMGPPSKNRKTILYNPPLNVQEIGRQRHVEPAEFIAYMDYELAHWNAVAVGFDISKTPDFPTSERCSMNG